MSDPTQRPAAETAPAGVAYLDQFAWIHLARARLGRALRPEHVEAREVICRSVREGRVSLPLSSVHYLETWKQANERRRGEVAVEMALLSRFAMIAPLRTLLRQEIGVAVRSVFGRPQLPPQASPFGFGVKHAFAFEGMTPDASRLPADERFLAEWAILTGLGPERYRDEELKRSRDAERFASDEFDRSTLLYGWNSSQMDRTRRFRIQALSDFHREVVSSLINAEVSIDEFAKLGPDGLEHLVSAIPSLWALTELRRVRLANPNQPFRATDLNDLRALAVSLVYCDIVVPDRAWIDMIRRTDVAVRNNTTVCAGIAELARTFS